MQANDNGWSFIELSAMNLDLLLDFTNDSPAYR